MKHTFLSELQIRALAKAGVFKPPYHPAILSVVSLQGVTEEEAKKIDQALVLANVEPVSWSTFPADPSSTKTENSDE